MSTPHPQNQTALNTDREIWRERPDDYYSNSIHVTKGDGIGVNVGGRVIVLRAEVWHEIALKYIEREARKVLPEGVAAPLEPSRKEFSLQLHIDWLAQDEISDFRNWLIEKLWAAAAVSKNLREELGPVLCGGSIDSVGGCGKAIPLKWAYRCSDCELYFHRDCLREHCETSSYVTAIRANKELITGWKKEVESHKQKVAELEKEITALRETK